MDPQNQGGIKAWQWVVTVIVIIALIIIGIIVFGSKKSEAPTGETPDTSTTDNTLNGLNRIVMSDQYPGNVVNLSSVQLEQPGFVTIHKDKNGQPGDIIGTLYLDKGINPGKITLSQSTIEGGVYYAMLHSDDGDKKFDANKDIPLKDSNGNIIMKVFRASSSVGVDIKG